jgi:uncharacterized membrane protein
MTLATYATRLSGLVVGRYLPREGRIKHALDALPPAVLTAVIAPAVVSGPAEMIAGAVTLLMALRFSLFPSMIVGVIAIVICRSGFSL